MILSLVVSFGWLFVSSGLQYSTLILYQWRFVHLCVLHILFKYRNAQVLCSANSICLYLYDVRDFVFSESINIYINATERLMSLSCHYSYLVDPASSHTLVLKIKPCMYKCFVFITLDCGRLIITVIVLLRLLYRWIPVVILELIHVTKNIYFYVLSIYLSSNQNALALWMIHNNVWRTL